MNILFPIALILFLLALLIATPFLMRQIFKWMDAREQLKQEKERKLIIDLWIRECEETGKFKPGLAKALYGQIEREEKK